MKVKHTLNILLKYSSFKCWYITLSCIIINLSSYIFKLRTYRELITFISSINENNYNNINYKLFIFFIKLIFFHFIKIFTNYHLKRTIILNMKNIMCNVVKKIIKYDIIFYNKYQTQVVEIWNYIDNIGILFHNIILDIPRILIYLIYFIYNIYIFSFGTMVLTCVIIIFMLYLTNFLSEKQYIYYNKCIKIFHNTKSIFNDTLNNIIHVKNTQQENYEINKILIKYETYHQLKKKNSQINSIKDFLESFISDIIRIIIFGIGIGYIIQKKMNSIDILYLSSHTLNLYTQAMYLKSIYNSYRKYITKIKLIIDILEYGNYEYIENYHNINLKKGQIIFKKLQFKHDNTIKNLFNNINIKLNLGKINVIIGKNGSGKTTLMYILLKYYKNYSGNILINNKNLKYISIASIRKKISIVLQKSNLFNDTVWYNIIYGITNVTDEHIYNIAESINIKKWLLTNKNKKIGIDGNKLSGGERKKLQLINTILQNKDIIILDEPTNGLDIQTVKWLEYTILQINKNKKTVIIITHDKRLVGLSNNTIYIK